MSEIDLGVKASDKYSLSEPVGPGSKEKVYPCFHYCGPVELDLPDEGELRIKFRKKRETSSVEEDGSHWYECDVEVRQILDVNGEEAKEEVEAPASSRDEASSALDKIAEGLMKLREHEEAEEGSEGY